MTAGAMLAGASLARPERPTRVLRFTGRLTYGEASAEHYRELCRAIQRGFRHVVFDLSGVPDVDSAGIGFLVESLTTVRQAGGSLCLAAPSAHVLRSLLITNLERVFPLATSTEAALRDGL